MFKKLVFFLVLSFALLGCGGSKGGDGGSTNTEDSVVATIVLTADKTTISADGTETVTLSVIVKDKDSAIINGADISYYEGTTKLTGNTFKTTTAGTYNMTAKSGTVTSNTLTITANNIINTEKDYKILETANNTCEIVDYLGTAKEITIPEKINGKTVTSIGKEAFYDKDLTSVIIPNSVVTINKSAFDSNLLTSITIPNSVTNIGPCAFALNRLTSVTIPNNVTIIGYSAFYSNLLTSITISNSVTIIDYAAFSNNILTSVIIPNGVISIKNNAFAFNRLTSVTIPDSVTTIGEMAFSTNRLISVTIPSSVNAIGNHAFGNNSNLTIYGIAGSVAETYATNNTIPFVAE